MNIVHLGTNPRLVVATVGMLDLDKTVQTVHQKFGESSRDSVLVEKMVSSGWGYNV